MKPSKASSIIDAVTKNPAMTAKELATSHSCSKQYVHNVLSGAGLKCATPVREWTPRGEPRRVVPRLDIPGNTTVVSTSVAGSIGELMAATDLMARGWKVFFPLFRAHSDLVAQSPDGKVLKRIEVRSARFKGGRLVFNHKAGDQCEHYALIIPGEPVLYRPPL